MSDWCEPEPLLAAEEEEEEDEVGAAARLVPFFSCCCEAPFLSSLAAFFSRGEGEAGLLAPGLVLGLGLAADFLAWDKHEE